MTLPTSIALWASATALLFSIGACLVTYLSWRRCQSHSAERLRTQLSDLREAVEDQEHRLRNLKSRYTMQNLRLSREAQPPASTAAIDPEESAAAARRELNDQLARGALKVNQ